MPLINPLKLSIPAKISFLSISILLFKERILKP
jgi:hypothetical protein